MDKQQLIRSIRDYLELSDFKPIGVGAGNVSLERNNERISISYRKYPGVYMLPGVIGGFKSFPEVENILKKYYDKYGIELQNDTIYTSSRRLDEITEIDIAEPDDIFKVLPQLKVMVFDDILPFFEKYNSILSVNKKIEELQIDEYSKLVFSPIHPRIMIIKRLSGASDWVEYSENALGVYEEQSVGKYRTSFAPINRFLPELYEELKQMEPL
ncbi:MAG: hypothetical protein KDC31_07165 [Saprospiraceae bacterium]|nr:MAG: hypothetical protein UZ08_BCD001001781 [Candidatus Parvibacillus calidus]MBX2938022.1 hypothetical protein [Saprospiraceae bacterium]MBK7742100.1 hypothetical protein [Candidatus Parvibacillus calidus]MCB0591053.1 hypothetical protein [Saprospiraceae bacterium]MCC7149755.1 hypothetical protein [Saprospiraceae bacterium]